MRKLLLSLILFVTVISSALAQELMVKSFNVAEGDLSAQTQSRKDLNNCNCAVVKVLFVGDIIGFDGNIIKPVVKHTNETWVYMPQNSRQLKITTKEFIPLMVTFADYGIDRLESNCTYSLTLLSNSAQQVQSHVAQTSTNSLVVQVKDGVSIEMVRVEAGTFMMGIDDGFLDGQNVHQVTLTNNYYIGKYEVTQALWKAVMGKKPSKFKGDNLPVEKVSWDDCLKFIKKLNDITGRDFRLPTEAEWEFAARGGNKSKGYLYSGSNNIANVAWYNNNGGSKTHPVGLKQANELGIFDMSGNVREWCQDLYGDYPNSAQTNPTGVTFDMATKAMRRVTRGGSWNSSDNKCLSSSRSSCAPIFRFNSDLGFRIVLTE